MEELVEIFESYELVAGQTLGRVEFTEGKLDAPHRHVGEQADEEQGGSGEDPQLPVAAEVVGDAIEQTWFSLRSGAASIATVRAATPCDVCALMLVSNLG